MNKIKKRTVTSLLTVIAAMLFSGYSFGEEISVGFQPKGSGFIAPAFQPKNLSATDSGFHPKSPGFIASMEHRVVEFVASTVNHLRYTAYELGGTRFDASRGIYILDCSSYVDHVLKSATPHAYSNLVAASGTIKPTSLEYYNFFIGLSPRSQSVYHWNKVQSIAQLRPGDILVFRYKNRHHRSSVGGHVMIVMKEPKLTAGAFSVRVADSASTGHSSDTRQPHKSGVGIGDLLLKANPVNGQPYAYAWKQGARWEKNVKFAMGRPV